MNPQGETLLKARGIYNQATALGWQACEDGWLYPVVHSDGSPYLLNNQPVVRKKAYEPSKVNPKYLWLPSKPRELIISYYLWSDTVAEIRKTGTVYLASGEPDHLVYREAGAKNVLSFFGEGNIPSDMITRADGTQEVRLLRDLKLMGAKRVFAYPDLDDQGRGFARKLHDLLFGSEIEFHAYRLPGEANSKYDINKLYIDKKFDEGAFWLALGMCDPLTFPAPLPPSTQLLLPSGRSTDYEELPAAFIAALEMRLQAKDFRDGWSAMFTCPFGNHEHDFDTPAAHWNADVKMLVCHKCKASGLGGKRGPGEWLAVEVGDKLNLRLQDYLPKRIVDDKSVTAIVKVNPVVSRLESVIVNNEVLTAPAQFMQSQFRAGNAGSGGLRMGFTEIDEALNGLSHEDLCVILSRTGNGKSSIAMQIALHLAKQGQGVIFSTEMSPIQYNWRVVCYLVGVHYKDIVTGSYSRISKENNDRVDNAIIEAGRSGLTYLDLPSPTCDDIMRTAEYFKAKNFRWMLVDSIQNVNRGSGDLFKGTENVMKALAYCAREVGITVLATCQANRGPAHRALSEPLMTDAQGGGCIEQYASRFLTLWRPGYDIEIRQVEADPANPVDPHVAYLAVAKDRHFGSQGTRESLYWEAGKGFHKLASKEYDFSHF